MEPHIPIVDAAANWRALLAEPHRTVLEQTVLPAWMQRMRWFGGKAHTMRGVKIADVFPFGPDATGAHAAFVEVAYLDAPSEVYFVPLQIASGEDGLRLPDAKPSAVIARLRENGVLHDAIDDARFRAALLDMIALGKRVAAGDGHFIGIPGRSMESIHADFPLPSQALALEQSHSSILYGDRFFLKLHRKLEDGVNLDAELMRHLGECQKFAHTPAFCGAIEHRRPDAQPRTLALLTACVPNTGTAWTTALAALDRFFERASALKPDPDSIGKLAGDFPKRARLLGLRTAGMHLALAAETSDPDFAPEPFDHAALQAVCESMTSTTRRTMELLRKKSNDLPEKIRAELLDLIAHETEILHRQSRVPERGIAATRTRIHGDFHLGQALDTGCDFVFLDFEGEPARPLAERRMKRSPLYDVAGMLRSFHYAAHHALSQHPLRDGSDGELQAWAEIWAQRIGRDFLDAYLDAARGASFLPADPKSLAILLEALLLEKAAYEVWYELNNRPDWAFIPARGIRQILENSEA